MANQKTVTDLIERLANKEEICKCGRCSICQSENVKLSQVKIGDILAKIKKEGREEIIEVHYNDGAYVAMMHRWRAERHKLVNLWGDCGFNKSLNEIVEASGYEEFCLNCANPICECRCAYCCDDTGSQLKSPEARRLVEFILELNLTK